ncbi:unnamed protein product [Paramecium octaurelia]|uniref:Protein kinase domain-containing protein n=1 Tax=Paramecium octaurelia TaxID=43137 RepID=A0A8S1XHI3_PAROT|nr:unnamed protein product [Paramecium octaurelia]
MKDWRDQISLKMASFLFTFRIQMKTQERILDCVRGLCNSSRRSQTISFIKQQNYQQIIMLPCLEKVYQMVLQTQLQFLDTDPILQIKLQDPYRLILKKEYLHIYKEDEPFIYFSICFPNVIQWHVIKNLLIGFSIKGFEFTSHQGDLLKKLKQILAGRLFFSRVQDFFIPLQTLGKGSSSKVLLVKEIDSGEFFAAKCVQKEEMQFQEIEINNQLQHSAFIKVKEVYQGETSYYIVMDLLSGKNLQSFLGHHKPLPLEQTKSIMHALLEGVEYMHSKNIMHRDIKPENIILEIKAGQVRLKIVDFGLATYSTLKRFRYPKCGTPGFVAPEVVNLQNSNQTYDKVCDIFSCGVIFYKLLTGRDVFPGSGFTYVLELNKKCNIDFSHLTLQQLPANLTVRICFIEESCSKNAIKRSQVETYSY